MADGGWIKVYRKIRQSFVWTDANQLKLWLLILMKASHEGNRFLFNGQQVDVSSGQFVTGRDALAFEFNEGVKRDHRIVARTLWRWIKQFEKEQMLSIKSTPQYSVITVIEWSTYQDGDHQVSIDRPSSVHHLSTIKNAKNAKNEKKEDSQQSRKREYADDSPEMIEAVYLWSKIKGNNPEHRKPNLQVWADDVRKMNQLDHRPFEKIHKMIDWCQLDTFWQTNILSASKLRSKYDTMAAQANRKFAANKQPRIEKLPVWAEPDYKPEHKKVSEEDRAKLAEQLKQLRSLGDKAQEAKA